MNLLQLLKTGHLSPFLPFLHRDMMVAGLRAYIKLGGSPDLDFDGLLNLEVFTDPRALWFYGNDEIDFETEGLGLNDPDNVWVYIVTPGEIALLGISRFLNNPRLDDAVIYPFLQGIRDFDHLIIDLRGNAGGYLRNFNEPILRRLINEPVSTSGHEFFGSGDLALEWTRFFFAQGGTLASPTTTEMTIKSAAEFIAYHNMEYFNPQDLESLEYVVIWHSEITPAADAVGFNGKIWLLVNGESASASSVVIANALQTGFATVVGENTSGEMGSLISFVVLPNTGIIFRIDIGYKTDSRGRSLDEHGIAPQIPNRPVMDALQTVLEIIQEARD